jgi:hypothetical protein
MPACLRRSSGSARPGHVPLPAFIPGASTAFAAKGAGLMLADLVLVAGAVRLWITGRVASRSLGDADGQVAKSLNDVDWLPMVGPSCYLGP